MAATRRASAYSKEKITHYTRKSKKRTKSYIKAVPQQMIVKFNMGKIKKFNDGEFVYVMKIVADETVQIRDMALEAVRQAIHKRMDKKFQRNFYLGCRCYPHQILRDNKTFSGGSKGERVQTGMKNSFGSTIGRAAYVKRGKDIFIAAFNGKSNIPAVKEIFRLSAPKLPGKTKFVLEERKVPVVKVEEPKEKKVEEKKE